MDLKRPVSVSQVVEALIAIAFILWRIWEVPVATLWRDWITLVSIFWLFEIVAPAGRSRKPVTIGFIAGFMVLYGWGQFPHLLAMLRSLT